MVIQDSPQYECLLKALLKVYKPIQMLLMGKDRVVEELIELVKEDVEIGEKSEKALRKDISYKLDDVF